ncbi:unnamed protein product [Polarella glacialis]|uniref:Ubiquitin-like domain-containing protein n=1 Tax=Polarella glacialis TaxID=89957 RepID=A0A813LSI9_POLGL|nr:unnamed protein product [Polarella glacialis]
MALLQLHVKTLMGKTLSFSASSSDTVGSLKEQLVAADHQVPADKQALCYVSRNELVPLDDAMEKASRPKEQHASWGKFEAAYETTVVHLGYGHASARHISLDASTRIRLFCAEKLLGLFRRERHHPVPGCFDQESAKHEFRAAAVTKDLAVSFTHAAIVGQMLIGFQFTLPRYDAMLKVTRTACILADTVACSTRLWDSDQAELVRSERVQSQLRAVQQSLQRRCDELSAESKRLRAEAAASNPLVAACATLAQTIEAERQTLETLGARQATLAQEVEEQLRAEEASKAREARVPSAAVSCLLANFYAPQLRDQAEVRCREAQGGGMFAASFH